RAAPLSHWSRERLFSVAARRRWVPPDLAPLPWWTPARPARAGRSTARPPRSRWGDPRRRRSPRHGPACHTLWWRDRVIEAAAGQPGREARRSDLRRRRGAPEIEARVAPAGLVHEAALYGDQDVLLDVVVPFVAAGARAGEAVVVALDGRDADRVRAATAGDPRIAYLSPTDAYARPAVTLRTFRSLVDRRLAGGIARVRMVGALPARVVGSAWDAWCRYEAAVERVFARAPVSLLCAYDTRV